MYIVSFQFPPGPYSYNSVVGRSGGQDVSVQFGGCDEKENSDDVDGTAATGEEPDLDPCLPITSGWGTAIRFFKPGQALIDGNWTVPDIVEK